MLNFGAVNLWKIEQQDLADHYRWANNDNIRRLVGGAPRPRNVAELEAWYKTVVNDTTQEVYTIKSARAETLGWAQLSDINYLNGCADVGIVVDESQWGQGIGHDALAALVQYAFEDLRLNRLGAEVLAVNAPSLKLFSRLGFQYEGTKREAYFTTGRHLDVVVFGLLCRDFSEPEPRTQAAQDSDSAP